LKEWFETETAPIEPELEAKAPGGSGGSILDRDTAIDSKRVLDATLITEEVLELELPPELIQPGGYDSFDEMIDDIVPKLREVFIGERAVRSRPTKQAVSA
jgi:hypothetical protein